MTPARERMTAAVKAAQALVAEHGRSNRVAAAQVLRQLDADTVRKMAEQWIVDQATREQRERSLEVERKAMRAQVIAEITGPGPKARSYRTPVGDMTPEQLARQIERNQEADEERARITAEMMADISGAVDRHLATMRMEWTAEILSSEIVMPDGTRTTWGEATVEQHEERRRMYEANATAQVEGAARHAAAVRDLREAGRDKLNALVGVAA